MFGKISSCLDKIIQFRSKASSWKWVYKQHQHYKDLFSRNGISYRYLNQVQKHEVDCIWRKYCLGGGKYNKYTYSTHELFYSVTGTFNPFIIPEDLWWPTIFRRVNMETMMPGWADKNYFEVHLPIAKFPETVVRNINGCLFNQDYITINEEEANRLLRNTGNLFVKSSIDSGAGKGVHLFKKKDIVTIKDINYCYKKNYIVQKVFNQHSDLSVLNESSVNVVRLITINNRGKTELLMAAVRAGNKGAINDWSPTSEGTGNVTIGIDGSGSCKTVGYEPCGKKVKCCSNGYIFDKHKIPKYDEMVKYVLRYHQQMPYFKMIGWDMSVDNEDRVTVIEYNVKSPGILYYQWCNGPLFGMNEERVHNYMKEFLS